MFLNIIQLAQSLGVEEAVVEDWMKNDGLPCVRDSGRLLFDRSQVVVWAAERGLAARTGFLAPGASKPAGVSLERLLRTGGIWRRVAPAAVLTTLQEVIHQLPGATPAIRQLLAQRLTTDKAITWAPVGGGWALPHLRTHVALGRDSGLAALLALEQGLPISDPPFDDIPVTRLIFFIAPTARAHLEILAGLSSALSRGSLKTAVEQDSPDETVFAAVSNANPGGAA